MKNYEYIKKWAKISLIITLTIVAILSVVAIISIGVMIILLVKETNILTPWWVFAIVAAACIIVLLIILIALSSPMLSIKKAARRQTITDKEKDEVKYVSNRLRYTSLIYNLKLKKHLAYIVDADWRIK